MTIDTDFTVTVGGDIRHSANAVNYTVLEMHRWLQDLADDAEASGNDLIDITSDTPSERSTDNIITLNAPYNIDDDAAEYLYAGSITQAGGDTIYSGLQVLGAVNNANTQLMVIQNNQLYPFTTTPSAPFWGDQSGGGYNGNAAAGVLMRCMIKSREFGADIDGKRIRVQARHWGDTYDFFNVTLGQGESVAAVGTTPDAQNTTTQGTISAYTHILNSGGTANAPTGGFQSIDLNNGNGAFDYYSQWTYGADTGGFGLRDVWEYIKDLSGNGTAKTIDSLNGELFLGISHSSAHGGITGAIAERETIAWGTELTYNTGTDMDLIEVGDRIVFSGGAGGIVTYASLGAATGTLYVKMDFGEVNPSAAETFDIFDDAGSTTSLGTIATVVGGTAVAGGTALLLASDTGNDVFYYQLLTGTAPGTGVKIIGDGTGGTITTSGAAVSKTIPKIYLGSYTGTLIGAYGVGLLPADLTANDSIEPLVGATQTPPNNVTFTVTGLISGEDRVLVGPRAAGILQKDQFTLTGNALVSGNTTVEINVAIPSDTPSAGDIRVENTAGVYLETPYTSYTGNVFTLTGTYGDTAPLSSNIFIAYIDELAGAATATFTSVYLSSRDLFVRVRDGGLTPIKTFEAPATLGASGGSIAAIRTTDL